MEEGGDDLAEMLRALVPKSMSLKPGEPAAGGATSAAPGWTHAEDARGIPTQSHVSPEAEGGAGGVGSRGRSLNDELRAGESGEDPAEHVWRRGAGRGPAWAVLGVDRLTGDAEHNKHVLHLRLAPSPSGGLDEVVADGGAEAAAGGAAGVGSLTSTFPAGYSPGDVALLAPRNRPAATQVFFFITLEPRVE